MKDKRVIGLVVVRGFGMFLLVTGMIGIAIILSLLNHLLGIEYHKLFGNTLLDLLLCFLLTVIGGAIEYVADGLSSIHPPKLFYERMVMQIYSVPSL